VRGVSAIHFSAVLIAGVSLFERGGCQVGINVLHSNLRPAKSAESNIPDEPSYFLPPS
jgi:hypothetical protein